MLLDIREALKNPGQSYPLDRTLALPPMDVLDERIAFEDVRLQGEYVGAGESVKVVGRAGATVRAQCAKCLEPVSEAVSADVDELFIRDADPLDADQRPMDGYEIDLGELVKDALLLALPLRFLCDEDCLGLCPVCGADRNKQRCTCQERAKHPFSALSELLTKDEEV